MSRLTKKEDVKIIGIDTDKLRSVLNTKENNILTRALEKLARYEELEESNSFVGIPIINLNESDDNLWILVKDKMPKPETDCRVSILYSEKYFDIEKCSQLKGGRNTTPYVAEAYYNENGEWKITVSICEEPYCGEHTFKSAYNIQGEEIIDEIVFKANENDFIFERVVDRKEAGFTTQDTRKREVIQKVYIQVVAWFPEVWNPYRGND